MSKLKKNDLHVGAKTWRKMKIDNTLIIIPKFQFISSSQCLLVLSMQLITMSVTQLKHQTEKINGMKKHKARTNLKWFDQCNLHLHIKNNSSYSSDKVFDTIHRNWKQICIIEIHNSLKL